MKDICLTPGDLHFKLQMQKSAEAVVVLIAMETWKEQRAEHK